MLIENIIVAIVMIVVTVLENHRINGKQIHDATRRLQNNRNIRIMSGFNDDEDLTKRELMIGVKSDALFLNRQIEQLLVEFGGRVALSMGDYMGDYKRPYMMPDPRHVHTYPMSP